MKLLPFFLAFFFSLTSFSSAVKNKKIRRPASTSVAKKDFAKVLARSDNLRSVLLTHQVLTGGDVKVLSMTLQPGVTEHSYEYDECHFDLVTKISLEKAIDGNKVNTIRTVEYSKSNSSFFCKSKT